MSSRSVRKFAVVPINKQTAEQVGGNIDAMEIDRTSTRRSRRPPTDRLLKAIKIILKLAHVNGYNGEGKLVREDGTALENTNVVHLLNHGLSIGRLLHGEDEFIRLLFKAKVEPELLINENVRAKLISLYEGSSKDTSEDKVVYSEPVLHEQTQPQPPPPQPQPPQPQRRAAKRKLYDEPPHLETEGILSEAEPSGAEHRPIATPTKKRRRAEKVNAADIPLPPESDEEDVVQVGSGWEIPQWVT